MEIGFGAEGSSLKLIASSCSATAVDPSCMCLGAAIGSWKAQGVDVLSLELLWLFVCMASPPYSGLSRRIWSSPQSRHKRYTVRPSGSVTFKHWG
ncbi:hypothetical protein ACE6H2_023247 [Prunus campanulata]